MVWLFVQVGLKRKCHIKIAINIEVYEASVVTVLTYKPNLGWHGAWHLGDPLQRDIQVRTEKVLQSFLDNAMACATRKF